jgi:Small metal-binding protein
MISKIGIGVAILGVVAFVSSGASWAYEEKAASPPAMQSDQPAAGEKGEHDKKQEKAEAKAITHTQKAIEEGKAGKADSLAKHAETALKIAETAEKGHAEAHVEEAIKHLQLAVDEGKKGNAAEGTKHAEEALIQLQKE